jgi:AcrR family transcriptional regulator
VRTDPTDAGAAATSKSQQTRAAIVAAATRLLPSGGYDATTMRAVAKEAGVSVGNAYYYFGSKEHLVLAFYDEIFAAHLEGCERVLARESGFTERPTAVLEIWVDVAESSHEFAGKFFKHAAEPTSPLSVFSPESAPTREAASALMRRVVEGSDLRVAPALRAELPVLLWLVQMGMVLSGSTTTPPAALARDSSCARPSRSSTSCCARPGSPASAASPTTSSRW